MPDNPFYASEFWRSLRLKALARDEYRCVVAGCDSRSHLTVDHIATRPNLPYPTEADCLGNLRTLCRLHDAQVKELPSGQRRRGGKPYVKGCDPSGRPLDPNHHWAKGSGP